MSLIHEYARNKEDKLIRNQLKAGLKAEFITRTNCVPLSRVRAIEWTFKSKK